MFLDNELFINCPYPGEMSPLERYTLYHQVIQARPEVIFELGSGEGASTYYIAEAIKYNGFGKLYTCDPYRSPTREFLSKYPFVKYYNLTSRNMIQSVSFIDWPDFVFMDGPEDSEIALKDAKALEGDKPMILGCHDWCTTPRLHDGHTSTKAVLLKKYLDENPRWAIIEELSGSEPIIDGPEGLPKHSVGLAFYKWQ